MQVANEDNLEGILKGSAPTGAVCYYLFSREATTGSVRYPLTGAYRLTAIFQFPANAPNGTYSVHYLRNSDDINDLELPGRRHILLICLQFGVALGIGAKTIRNGFEDFDENQRKSDRELPDNASQHADIEREMMQHSAAAQINRQTIDLSRYQANATEVADAFALNKQWRVETASQAKLLHDFSVQMAHDAKLHMRTFREMQEMQADALKAIRGQLRMEPSEGGGGGGALTGAVGAIRELILLARGVVGGRGAGEEGQEAMSSLFESMGGKKKKKKNKRDKGDPVDRVRQQAESAPSAAEIDEMMSALRQVRDAKEQAAKQGQEAKSPPAEESPENKP